MPVLLMADKTRGSVAAGIHAGFWGLWYKIWGTRKGKVVRLLFKRRIHEDEVK